MKTEYCVHEWRPVVDLEKLRQGAGSEVSRIGSFCMKCPARSEETHLMESK